jgi:hypothetical protein
VVVGEEIEALDAGGAAGGDRRADRADVVAEVRRAGRGDAGEGLHTHQRAIDAGCRLAGATVHFVTPELDHGPIVAQVAVPVANDETESSLSERVLRQEHVIYPRAVRWFVDGRLTVQDNRVMLDGDEAQWLIGD